MCALPPTPGEPYTWCFMKRFTLTASFDPDINPLRLSCYPRLRLRMGKLWPSQQHSPLGYPCLVQAPTRSSAATLAGF